MNKKSISLIPRLSDGSGKIGKQLVTVEQELKKYAKLLKASVHPTCWSKKISLLDYMEFTKSKGVITKKKFENNKLVSEKDITQKIFNYQRLYVYDNSNLRLLVHDIRNSLNTIHGFLELAKTEKEYKHLKEYLDMIEIGQQEINDKSLTIYQKLQESDNVELPITLIIKDLIYRQLQNYSGDISHKYTLSVENTITNYKVYLKRIILSIYRSFESQKSDILVITTVQTDGILEIKSNCTAKDTEEIVSFAKRYNIKVSYFGNQYKIKIK